MLSAFGFNVCYGDLQVGKCGEALGLPQSMALLDGGLPIPVPNYVLSLLF